MEIRDGHIIENNVEVLQAIGKAVSDFLRYLLSLGKELGGVVASDN